MNNKKIRVIPIILCGGYGTRLWPLSRTVLPKQFLNLFDTKTLFQKTIERISGITSKTFIFDNILVVAGEEQRFIIIDQLKEIGVTPSKVLLEPVGRNTAAALTMAALETSEGSDDPILLVLPSDHSIRDTNSFQKAILDCVEVAMNNSIALIGIVPDRPESGYGYIKIKDSSIDEPYYEVEEFFEKPELKKAAEYISSGIYSWNGGIFVMKTSLWLNTIKKLEKDIYDKTKKAYDTRELDLLFIRPDPKLFKEIPNKSIDIAVIEKCLRANISLKMIKLDAGWNDLGSWRAAWEENTKSLDGNLVSGDVVVKNSVNNLVVSNNRLVTLLNVKNLVVVETIDAVLVANMSSCQDVKLLVEDLKGMSRPEVKDNRKVHRPWGWYDVIDVGEKFKVKRIQVNPGASLSLQRHKKRAEHWVVVNGTAEVVTSHRKKVLKENESTFISIGQIHRLSNPGSIPLEIIEIQTGLYLEEDDIERLDDNYNRK